MSVIIRLQNLPWSANALDIRNFFRGLSIPEGGVHIVGGELGDAFIAFSTDEDARQAMMLDCGKIKEIQVRLLLSSRSEMHKVIETARQSVPILSLAPAAPASQPAPAPPVVSTPQPTPIIPTVTPFSAALGNNSMSNYGIPGIGNPQEIPQPAVIEPPAPLISPTIITPEDDNKDEERKRSREKDKRRTRSRSRSRDRDRKDRKRDRRDRSRSRDRRRRDRSRSRDRRDRKRDRNRSRSHDRSPSRRSRDRRNDTSRKTSPGLSQEKNLEPQVDTPAAPMMQVPPMMNQNVPPHLQQQMLLMNSLMPNGMPAEAAPNRMLPDPSMADAFSKLQELGKKRNPNAFQGQSQEQQQQNNGGRFQGGRGGANAGRGSQSFRRGERPSRFEGDCCVAIRNAPNHTSYGDVRRFFPFMIDKHGIKMINDNMGRRTGNIFVRFCDPRSKQLALQRKINELKGANVLVEPLDDEAYESAVDSFLPFREDNNEDEPALVIPDDEPKPSFSVLKLSDLPNFVKEHDIIKIFSEFSLLSIMLNDCRMTRSKIAYVQFVKSEDAKVAFDRKDSYMFGRRHPTITPVSDEDYDKEKLTQSEKMPEIQQAPPAPKVTPQEEVQAPRDPRQRRQFDNGAQGGPPAQTPQAPFFPGPFVPQNPMPQNFVAPYVPTPFSGFPGTGAVDPRTAAANWATRPGGPLNQPNQMNQMPMGPQNPPIDLEEDALDCVLMKGLPRDATDRTIVTFLSDTSAVPARIHLMLDTNGHPSGDCFCEFRSTQEARMAATKHGHSLDGCNVTVDLVTRSVVEDALEGPKQMENMRESLIGSAPNVSGQFFNEGSNSPGNGPRGFAPRGGYRGRGGFDGNRGGFDGNRGGFDSNRSSFDNRGGFDSNRGGFDSNRGGFDGNRGVFDRYSNRGGFDQGRGGYRGRGGFDRGRGFERGRGRGFGGRGRGGGPYENGGRDHMRTDEEQDPALEDFGAPGCVVSVENVPFRATIDDIMTFFSEFELTQDDIIRRYNERGQPTGDARVAFRTPFDAQRAVKTRHMDTIHDRRINLSII